MNKYKIGRIAPEVIVRDRHRSGHVWFALALAILAAPASAAPAAGTARASPTQYYNCEYASSVAGQPLRTNFRFDPGKPYSFMEAFAAGHSIHTVVVTADQVVDQVILYNNPRDPERASGIAFFALNRKTLAFRQHVERVNPATYEPVVASDRSGTCALGRDPFTR